MVGVRAIENSWGAQILQFLLFFYKTVIPLALVEYEKVIANSHYAPHWLSTSHIQQALMEKSFSMHALQPVILSLVVNVKRL